MLTIQPATIADLPALIDMNRQLLDWHAKRYPEHFLANPSKQAISAEMRQYLDDDSYTCLIATKSGAPAGYILFEHQSRGANHTMSAQNRLHIHHIHVASSHKRQGIGRAMMAEVINNMAESKEITLETWGQNDEAKAFFEAAGFATQRIVMALR